MFESPEPKSTRCADIAAEICERRGITLNDLKTSRSRKRHFIEAKHEVWYWCRRKTGLSYNQIINVIHKPGYYNHTTMVTSVKRFADKHGLPEIYAGKAPVPEYEYEVGFKADHMPPPGFRILRLGDHSGYVVEHKLERMPEVYPTIWEARRAVMGHANAVEYFTPAREAARERHRARWRRYRLERAQRAIAGPVGTGADDGPPAALAAPAPQAGDVRDAGLVRQPERVE